MAWILLVLQQINGIETPIGEQAMRYQATIFESLLKELPRHRFDHLVDKHQSDYRCRRLPSWTHLVSLIFAQLSGSRSLRELETGLNSHANMFYHLGIGKVCRSTLSDANAHRSPELFEDVFGLLLDRLQGQMKRQLKEGEEVLRLLDATPLALPSACIGWAPGQRGKSGGKAHVVYDPDAQVPVYYTVTGERISDLAAARQIPLETGATYVFDRGYYDFAWWAKLAEHKCRFVTRLKKNSPAHVIKNFKVDEDAGGTIISDRLVRLNQRMARNRRNPYRKPLREVIVAVAGGKTLRLVTNDMKASAGHIAKLYKTRWQVELFFKWTKQNLRIRKFLGTSANAVRIQIAAAMIAFLLIRLARKNVPERISMQTLSRLIRVNIMHRKTWKTLLEPPPRQTRTPNQNPQIAWNF